MTVEIDEHTAYEPDTVVHYEEALADDAVIVPAPIVIVEVLSPTTRGRDAGARLADYFRLPSVRHDLLVRTERRTVIHHRGDDKGDIATRIITAGTLDLDPPGLTPSGAGNDQPVVYPSGLFHAADGDVAIAPSPQVHIRRLLETLRLAHYRRSPHAPTLVAAPACADYAAGLRNREALRPLDQPHDRRRHRIGARTRGHARIPMARPS
jgi:hypothetical protein